MTSTIIISFCILIIIAYIFDLSSKHTKIPTVILLLLLGWGAHQLAIFFDIRLPDLKPLLPIIGTVGLILIVLEGGLELNLNKDKKKILVSSSLSAIIPIVFLFLIIGFAFSYFSDQSLSKGFINALPFCIISSSIAIPSAQNLGKEKKEFIIYESSISDIFGVLIFNMLMANEIITMYSIGSFFLQLLIIIVVSFAASLGLAYLIKRIDHHIKFIPIIMMVILIYSVSKIYHLPALIFIMIFGLFLNNLDELKNLRFVRKLEPEKLGAEVVRFTEIVTETTFLVRTVFFLLFGFVIDINSFLDPEGMYIAIAIVAIIFLIRFVQLKIAKMEFSPLLFIAPRGLINILLFLSIPVSQNIPFVSESLMIQVILIMALVMMIGLMFTKKKSLTD
jgi:cell volume regulation protein A